jgi:hypothetical protein
LTLDIRTRKRKKYTPCPGDVFADEYGGKWLLALNQSGEHIAVSLDTWIAFPISDMNPASYIDSMLILTEDE